MALPKQIIIKEDLLTLKTYAKNGNDLIRKRMRLLIELKKGTPNEHSKRALSEKLGVNHNSIVKWRNLYISNGIESLL